MRPSFEHDLFADDSPYTQVAEINMIPFIDIMLVLLIVFMVATPLLAHKIAVQLPQAQGAAPMTPTEKPLELVVSMDGTVQVGAVATSVEGLPQVLAALAKEKPLEQVAIRADRNARYDTIAQVMGALQARGVSKIGFITSAAGMGAPSATP